MASVELFKSLLLLLVVARTSPSAGPERGRDLVVLAMAPFWDPDPSPSWYGGAAMMAAADLAVQHVNSRADVLQDYTLRLLEADSGCDLIEKTLVEFTAYLYHHNLSHRVVGMVGPGCSVSAEVLAPVISRPKLDLMQVSIVTTPDIRLDPNKPALYKNSFRTVGSSLVFVDGFVQLMQKFNWASVGALYENSRQFHTSTYSAFRRRVGDERLQFTYGLVESNLVGFVRELRRSCIRVIFVFASEKFSQNVLCLAFKNALTYPQVQFVFAERVREDFTSKSVLVNGSTCSVEEMQRAMEGVILISKRNNTESDFTVANITYSEYLSSYEERYEEYLTRYGLKRIDVSPSASIYFSGYYDAVWAMALALNKSASRIDLSKYSPSRSRNGFSSELRANLEATDFEGMSGRITFNRERRDVPTIGAILSQSTVSSGNVTGEFVNHTLSFSGVGISDVYATETHAIPLPLGVVMMLMASSLSVLLSILHIAQWKYSNLKEVKATSPILNHLIFSGCYLFLLLVAVFIFQETFPSLVAANRVAYGILCSVNYWCLALGFTLVFGTISSKTWRIYRIFSHFRQGRVRLVSDEHLTLFVSALMLVDVALLTAWNLKDPWRLSTILVKNGSRLVKHHRCACENEVYWIAGLFSYKGLLIVLVVYLSILVRRVKRKAFKSTKKVIALIYALVLVFFVGLTLYGVLFNLVPVVSFLALCLTFSLSVVIITVSLFLTNIWPHMVHNVRPATPSEASASSPVRRLRRGMPSVAVNNRDHKSFIPPVSTQRFK